MRTPLPVGSHTASYNASTTTPCQNVLHRTLRLLWQSISPNRDQIISNIPGLSDGSKRIMFYPRVIEYDDVVCNGILMLLLPI